MTLAILIGVILLIGLMFLKDMSDKRVRDALADLIEAHHAELEQKLNEMSASLARLERRDDRRVQ